MHGLLGPLLIAALVLAAAGLAKTVRPRPAAAAISTLPLTVDGSLSVTLARMLGIVEVAVAVWAMVTLSAIALAFVAGFYGAFAVFVLLSLNGSVPAASCGCFGSDDSPPTVGHFVFNAVAAGLAIIGATQRIDWAQLNLSVGSFVVLSLVVSVGAAFSVLAMSVLPSVLSLANGTSVPVRNFEIDPHLRSQVNS